eukprot:TRINITY_DN527_c0_g1_i11.p1 TRINITY_DN527_c0_g1~~TRINITY_DN527_c0_g1_i11.p1  ORF type:complete len:478 (-),score=110.34 TRINITY_DN527_c0_g1_i11:139-1572(-)
MEGHHAFYQPTHTGSKPQPLCAIMHPEDRLDGRTVGGCSQERLTAFLESYQASAIPPPAQLQLDTAALGKSPSGGLLELSDDTQQLVSDLVDKYDTALASITKLQNYFLQAKDRGPEKLAEVLYGKLNVDALTGSLLGSFLEHFTESRKWEKRWCMLRDNFFFIFKTYRSNDQPLETIYLPDASATELVLDNPQRKYCFRVVNQLFASDTGGAVEDWVSAIKSTKPWHEKRDDEVARIKSQAEALAAQQQQLKKSKSTSNKSTPLKKADSEGKLSSGTPKPRTAMFGVPVEGLARREGGKVPVLIEKLTHFITANACEEEGIFRIPGSVTEMERLKENLEVSLPGSDVDFVVYDPHAVAGVLKAFFRELPDPLIPFDMNQHCLDLFEKMRGENATEQQIATEMASIIRTLPQLRFEIVKCMCDMVIALEKRSDINRMSIDNLLTCLVPSIRCVPAIFLLAAGHYGVFFDTQGQGGTV